MSDDNSKTSSNFFTGLLFGAAAGAAGYFFMKTDEGKKARKKLGQEWEKAKEDLVKSGVIEDATKSLPQTIQHTIQRIIEPHRSTEPIEQTDQKDKKSAPKKVANKEASEEKKTRKESSSKKFKGA